MKIYIAGPMRGKPHWNSTAFDNAEARWRSAGHHPFSPGALVSALGYNTEHDCEPQNGTDAMNHLRHVMLSDVACLLASDAIALLDGWEESRGATVELALAQFLGLKVFDAETMVEIFPPTRPWTKVNVVAV